jgi:Tfp pilus assembly protein PilN
MIKINLLDSVTDRPTGVAMVEDRVSSRGVQTLLLALTVFGLLVLGMASDYLSAQRNHAAAVRELENQQRIERQMIAVNKEQEELQKKVNDIQVRIDAIQKLKAGQQGPVAVLREIKARFDNAPGLYLQSIEQKGDVLIIKGQSPCNKMTPAACEAAVTRFGQSFEFSNGLFADLHIETVRQVFDNKQGDGKPAEAKQASPVTVEVNPLLPLEVVNFTVKCNYNAAKANPAPQPPAPANQVAKN